jgi:cyd operon protein YbgT
MSCAARSPKPRSNVATTITTELEQSSDVVFFLDIRVLACAFAILNAMWLELEEYSDEK